MLPHHGLLLRGPGGEEVRAVRAEGGEEGEGGRHNSRLRIIYLIVLWRKAQLNRLAPVVSFTITSRRTSTFLLSECVKVHTRPSISPSGT